MLIHHPIDPLFLVIPLVLPLVAATSESAPFQPLSSLISTAASSSAHGLLAPFTKPTKDVVKSEWNEDVGRLLGMKSVKRCFKLCCDKKGESACLARRRAFPLITSDPQCTAFDREHQWRFSIGKETIGRNSILPTFS